MSDGVTFECTLSRCALPPFRRDLHEFITHCDKKEFASFMAG